MGSLPSFEDDDLIQDKEIILRGRKRAIEIMECLKEAINRESRENSSQTRQKTPNENLERFIEQRCNRINYLEAGLMRISEFLRYKCLEWSNLCDYIIREERRVFGELSGYLRNQRALIVDKDKILECQRLEVEKSKISSDARRKILGDIVDENILIPEGKMLEIKESTGKYRMIQIIEECNRNSRNLTREIKEIEFRSNTKSKLLEQEALYWKDMSLKLMQVLKVENCEKFGTYIEDLNECCGTFYSLISSYFNSFLDDINLTDKNFLSSILSYKEKVIECLHIASPDSVTAGKGICNDIEVNKIEIESMRREIMSYVEFINSHLQLTKQPLWKNKESEKNLNHQMIMFNDFSNSLNNFAEIITKYFENSSNDQKRANQSKSMHSSNEMQKKYKSLFEGFEKLPKFRDILPEPIDSLLKNIETDILDIKRKSAMRFVNSSLDRIFPKFFSKSDSEILMKNDNWSDINLIYDRLFQFYEAVSTHIASNSKFGTIDAKTLKENVESMKSLIDAIDKISETKSQENKDKMSTLNPNFTAWESWKENWDLGEDSSAVKGLEELRESLKNISSLLTLSEQNNLTTLRMLKIKESECNCFDRQDNGDNGEVLKPRNKRKNKTIEDRNYRIDSENATRSSSKPAAPSNTNKFQRKPPNSAP
ncbi:MAG: hypothetical protein MHMPM18_001133 [Marteilia pararefringens]